MFSLPTGSDHQDGRVGKVLLEKIRSDSLFSMLCCNFRTGNNRVVGRPVAGGEEEGEEDGRVCEKLAEAPSAYLWLPPTVQRHPGESAARM